MIREIYYTFKTLNMRASGRNASSFRLLYQSIPLFFLRNGYSFPPINLYLSVNSNCNLKCKMCDIGQENIKGSFYKNIAKEDKTELPFEVIKKLVDDIASFKPTVHICCVEPLLYEGVGHVCKYITDKGMSVDLTTNGLLLEKKVEEIILGRVRNLWISLDGPPEIHDSIRGIKGAFELAKRGLYRIQELKRINNLKTPFLNCIFVTSNHNYFCIEDFVNSIYKMNFKKVLISNMNFVTKELSEKHNRIFSKKYMAYPANVTKANPLEVDIDILYNQVQNIKTKYLSRYSGNIVFSPSLNKQGLKDYYQNHEVLVTRKRCFLPWGSAQINADGEMIIFSRCLPITFGNIREKSFLELWNGPKIREFRKDLQLYHNFPVCTRCTGIL